jgi:hypothetical protein
MDAAVLLVFAFFFTAIVILATTPRGGLRTSVRRPRLLQLAVVAAAALTVPVDLYAVVYGTVGPAGASLSDVADRLLLLNVAASCGVAALHESIRGSSAEPSTAAEEPVVRMGVLGWIGPLIALVAVTSVVVLGSRIEGPGTVGPVWAVYSLLICVISAIALLRSGPARAIDPREG